MKNSSLDILLNIVFGNRIVILVNYFFNVLSLNCIEWGWILLSVFCVQDFSNPLTHSLGISDPLHSTQRN